MDAPPQAWRQLDPMIAQRYNVPEWYGRLLVMVLFNQKEQLLQLLGSAGDDAKSLVSSHRSDFGTILDAAYSESQQEIREIILLYMSDESLMNCFEGRKKELYAIWQHNTSQMGLQKKSSNESILRTNPSDIVLIPSADLIPIPSVDLSRRPSAEAIVRDLYQKDPNRYSLTQYEREKLDIKSSINN